MSGSITINNLSPRVRTILENAIIIAREHGNQYVDVQDLIESVFNGMDKIQIRCRLMKLGKGLLE